MNREDVEKLSTAAKGKINLLNSNFGKYFMRAIMAGFFIDVAMIYSNVVGNVFSKTFPEWGKFLGALVFSIAVLLIVMVGGELFTGNNLVMAFGAYDKSVSWKDVGKVWGISYIGNFVGCLILALICVYRLSDFVLNIMNPFYLDMGFTKTDIGLIAKHAGLWPAVIGALLGGLWMVKLGINRALWLFGVVQLVSIFGFAWLAAQGHYDSIGAGERIALAFVIGLEALGVGLGTAAFVAFIARATHPAYTATQMALFTSLAAVPRTWRTASATPFMPWM